MTKLPCRSPAPVRTLLSILYPAEEPYSVADAKTLRSLIDDEIWY